MAGDYNEDDDPLSYDNLIRKAVDRAADKWGVDRAVAHGLTFQESRYNPHAIGPMTRYGWKAKGLTQLSPDVAKQYGVTDIYDPEQNVNAGMGYLRSMIDKYGPDMGVAAYNMGPGNADKVNAGHMPMPAQTKAYVPLVQQYANQYRKGQPLGPRKLTKSSLQTAANRTTPAIADQPGDSDTPDTTQPQEPEEPSDFQRMIGVGTPSQLPKPEYNEKTDPLSYYNLSRQQAAREADEQIRQEAVQRHARQAAPARQPSTAPTQENAQAQLGQDLSNAFSWKGPAEDKVQPQRTGRAQHSISAPLADKGDPQIAGIVKGMQSGKYGAGSDAIPSFWDNLVNGQPLFPEVGKNLSVGIEKSLQTATDSVNRLMPERLQKALESIDRSMLGSTMKERNVERAQQYQARSQEDPSLSGEFTRGIGELMGDVPYLVASGGMSAPVQMGALAAIHGGGVKEIAKAATIGKLLGYASKLTEPAIAELGSPLARRVTTVASHGATGYGLGAAENAGQQLLTTGTVDPRQANRAGLMFGGQAAMFGVMGGDKEPARPAEAPPPIGDQLRTVLAPTGAEPSTPAQPTPFGAGEVFPIRREVPPPAGYGEGEVIPIGARKVAQAAPDVVPNPAEPRKTRSDTGTDLPGERVAAPLGESKLAAVRNSQVEGLRNRNQELQQKIKEGTDPAQSTIYRTELARNLRQIETIQAAPAPEPLATPGSPGETEAQAPGTPRGAVDQSGKPIVRQGANVQTVPEATPMSPDQEIAELRAKTKPAMQLLAKGYGGKLTPEMEAAQIQVQTAQDRIRQLEAQRDRGQPQGVQQIPPPQRQPQASVGDQLRAALVGDTQGGPGAGESGEVIPIRRPPPPAPPVPPAPEPPLLPEGEGGAIAPIRREAPAETPPGQMPTTPAQGEGEVIPLRRPGQPPPGYGEGEVVPITRRAPAEAPVVPEQAPAAPEPAPVEAAPPTPERAPVEKAPEAKSVLPEAPTEEEPLPEEPPSETPRGTVAETAKPEAPEGPDKAEQEFDLLPAKEKTRGEHGKLAQGFFKASEPGGKDAVYNDPGFREALGVSPNASMGDVHKALARAIGEMRGVDPDTVSMSSVHPGEVIKWINKNAPELRGTPTWEKIGRSIGYYKNERIGAKPTPIAPAPTEPTGPMPQISDKVVGDTFNQIRAADEAGTLTPAHIAEGKRQLANYRKIAAQRGLDADTELERIGGVPEVLEPKPTLPEPKRLGRLDAETVPGVGNLADLSDVDLAGKYQEAFNTLKEGTPAEAVAAGELAQKFQREITRRQIVAQETAKEQERTKAHDKVTLGEGVKVEAPAKPDKIESEIQAHRVSDTNVEQMASAIGRTVKGRPAEADRHSGTATEDAPSGGTAAMPHDRLLPGAEQIPSAESEGGPPLSQTERDIETRFRNYLATHTEEAVRRYYKMFGKEINTDNVRELSHDFRDNPPTSRQLYAGAVHEPSSWLAKKLLTEIVKLKPEEGQENLALATAGGSGAGKSSLLRKLGLGGLLDKSQFIFDSNLHQPKKAIQKIDQMLTGRRKVVIEAVYRDPVEALDGVLKRALNNEYGRMVSIRTMVETHGGMIDSLSKLREHYQDNPNVEFMYIDNTHGLHKAIRVPDLFDAFKEIDHAELERQLHAKIDELYKNDDIPEPVWRIAKGYPPEGPIPEGSGRGAAVEGGAKGRGVVGAVPGSQAGGSARREEPEPGAGAETAGRLQPGNEGAGAGGNGRTEPGTPQKAALTNPTARDIPDDIKLGDAATRVTEKGTRVRGHYAVVEGDRLKSSFDYHTMEPRADFPQELQGRQKDRDAADAQLRSMAAGLNSDLLVESPHVGMGAPTAAPNLELEVGRTRFGATQLALENNGPRGKAYREKLAENAEAYGTTPEEIAGMKKPTLVFIRTTPVDRVKFADEGDETPTTTMTPIEQAHKDVKNLDEGLMNQFVSNDEGNLNLDANLDFIRGFVGKLPASERTALLTKKGKLNQVGLTRVRNAVFNKAYGHVPEGEHLLDKLSEATDDTTKNITNAMVMRAPAFARLRGLIEKGARHDLDVSGDLAVAANKISELKESGLTLEKAKEIARSQPDMFEQPKELTPFQEQLVNLLENNKRSPSAINDIFTYFTDGVEDLGNPKQPNILGERKIVPSKELAVASAEKAVYEDRAAQKARDQERAAQRAAAKAESARSEPGLPGIQEGGGEEEPNGGEGGAAPPAAAPPTDRGEGAAQGPGVEKGVSPTEAEGVDNVTYRHGGIGLGGIPVKNLRQVQDAMRTVETLVHLTAPFKQGLWYSVTKPQHLAETTGNMFKSFKDSNYQDAMKGLMTTPEAAIGRKAGLWNAGEGDMARKIYGLKAALKAHGEDMADVNAIMKGQFGTKEPNSLDWQQKADAVDMLSRWAKDVGAKQPRETDAQYKERITQSEEAFQSPALEKVPILGAWARKSKNTYNAFLDTQRQLVFRDYVKQLEKSGKTFESNPQTYKDLATLINSHTGRGDLGEYLNKHSDLLGTALFSPRYIKSRLDFFNPNHYVDLGQKGALAPEVRRANIKEAVQFVSTVGGMMALAKLGGANIGMDPTKNDFAKLKWGGRTTSVLGGYEDYFRFFAQTARALYQQNEGTLGRNESTAADIVGRFVRGKLAPGVSLGYDIASGTDFRHKPTNIKSAIAERFTPFFVNDIKEAIQGGQSPGQIAAGAGLGLFGARSYPTDSRPGKLADVDESTPLGKEQIRHKIAEPLTTIDIAGDQREPSDVFKARRARVSGWWQEYGTKLVESDGYKKLTPMLQERALNSLRDRLSEQGRLKVPNFSRLNPDTIIGGAYRAERSASRGQEKRERTREWTPTLEQP